MAVKKKATKRATAKKKVVKRAVSRKKTAKKKSATTATIAGPAIGKAIPDFTLPSTEGQAIRLSSLKGKHVVLYFYPRDNTPGCTIEGRDFRDRHAEFARLNTVIYGISRDSLKSHGNFRQKENFAFHLLADETETACKLFAVMKMKNMYGKMVRGIERSTFLIDRNGILRQEWRKVKIEGHADDVLAAVRTLNE